MNIQLYCNHISHLINISAELKRKYFEERCVSNSTGPQWLPMYGTIHFSKYLPLWCTQCYFRIVYVIFKVFNNILTQHCFYIFSFNFILILVKFLKLINYMYFCQFFYIYFYLAVSTLFLLAISSFLLVSFLYIYIYTVVSWPYKLYLLKYADLNYI